MPAIHSRPYSPIARKAKRPRTTGNWENREESWWIEFREDFWRIGEGNLGGPGTVLEIRQEQLWERLGGLDDSRGKILFREVHEEMYKRMCYAVKNGRDVGMKGAIITGQPGIGKSYFAVIILLKCMAKGVTVMYTDALGSTFLVDDNGIREMPTNSIHYDHDLGGSPTPWSLVDSGDNQPIPISVTRALPFSFVFASPRFDRFKALLNRGARKWIMTGWSDKELYQLFQKMEFKSISNRRRIRDMKDVKRLRTLLGSSPRDILEYIRDPEEHMQSIVDAVSMLRNVHSIANFLRTPSSPAETFHQLSIMDRAGPLHHKRRLMNDNYSASVKGDIVLDVLIDRLLQLSTDDVRELRRSCSYSQTGLWGFVFGQHAIRCMSLNDPNALFHLYASMSQGSRGLPGKPSIRFSHQPSPVKPRVQKLPGLRSRWITRWREADSEPFSDTALYVPTVDSDALFEAFFIDCSFKKSAVLWIMKTIVSPAYDGSAQGYHAVVKIAEKLEMERACQVGVKYLLVVPQEIVETSEVSWDMATEPCSVAAGEVFIQSLGMGYFL